jgi:hypothetical protein
MHTWDPRKLHREHDARALEVTGTAKTIASTEISPEVMAAIMADANKGRAKLPKIGPVADPNKVRAVLREAREEKEAHAAARELERNRRPASARSEQRVAWYESDDDLRGDDGEAAASDRRAAFRAM